MNQCFAALIGFTNTFSIHLSCMRAPGLEDPSSRFCVCSALHISGILLAIKGMAVAAFALVGVLDYTDDVAMASTGGIVCIDDPCTRGFLRGPGAVDGLWGSVRGFSIEGDPSTPCVLLVHSLLTGPAWLCVGPRVLGWLSRHLSGSLMDREWAAECTDFEGNVTSLVRRRRLVGLESLTAGAPGS